MSPSEMIEYLQRAPCLHVATRMPHDSQPSGPAISHDVVIAFARAVDARALEKFSPDAIKAA
jgi:hypothetical protein